MAGVAGSDVGGVLFVCMTLTVNLIPGVWFASVAVVIAIFLKIWLMPGYWNPDSVDRPGLLRCSSGAGREDSKEGDEMSRVRGLGSRCLARELGGWGGGAVHSLLYQEGQEVGEVAHWPASCRRTGRRMTAGNVSGPNQAARPDL